MSNELTKHSLETVATVEKELRYIAAIVKQKGREIVSQYTITPPQFVALQWLEELGDITIGELSNRLYLAFSTTTDLVDRMEKNELVKRVRDENDRRVVVIHLLEKGERIIKEVIEKRQLYLQEMLVDFDVQETEQFSSYLQKLHEHMKQD